MELKASDSSSSNDHSTNSSNHEQPNKTSSFPPSEDLSLKSLSKLIVPPLGASAEAANPLNNSPNPRIISPMNSRYRCWETLMVVLVAYSVWVCPYEIAFLNSNPTLPLYIADNIVDLFRCTLNETMHVKRRRCRI